MTKSNMKIVHETEAQRQHVRVKIPAILELDNSQQLAVKELSASGLSFESNLSIFQVGQAKSGLLKFNLDGILLSLQVTVQIKHIDPATGRVGCVFSELGIPEINSLRQIITSFLAGELSTTGDVLSTLKRDNFTKSRKSGFTPDQQSQKDQIKALIGSAAAFVAGLSALIFVLNSLYSMYFVSTSVSAFVDTDEIVLTLPRNGILTALIPADSYAAQGTPIATLSSNVVDFIEKNIDLNTIASKKLKELMNTELQTVLTSPCDCVIAKQLIENGQFGNKGHEAFILVPAKKQAYITARFENKHFQHLNIGTHVNIEIAGEKESLKGIISNVEIDSKKVDEIIVKITPENSLAMTLINRPVQVTLANRFIGAFFESTEDKSKSEI